MRKHQKVKPLQALKNQGSDVYLTYFGVGLRLNPAVNEFNESFVCVRIGKGLQNLALLKGRKQAVSDPESLVFRKFT